MLSYRFRLYPSKKTEKILNRQLELCRWLYNRLLSELNLVQEKGIKLKQTDTQSLIVDLKEKGKPEFGELYSKVLQMISCQLWSDLRAPARQKRKGRKVGKPAEMAPLLGAPAQAVVAEQAPSLRQEAPCESWGWFTPPLKLFIRAGKNKKFDKDGAVREAGDQVSPDTGGNGALRHQPPLHSLRQRRSPGSDKRQRPGVQVHVGGHLRDVQEDLRARDRGSHPRGDPQEHLQAHAGEDQGVGGDLRAQRDGLGGGEGAR